MSKDGKHIFLFYTRNLQTEQKIIFEETELSYRVFQQLLLSFYFMTQQPELHECK